MRVLVSILLLIAVAAVSYAREVPLHTETVSDYETVVPEIIRPGRTARNADDNQEFIVKIKKDGESLTLHLLLNDKLMAPHFKSISYDEDGNEIITTGEANCYYQGTVEEHEDWTVVMNACGGLKGFFGNINNKTEYYRLEPLSSSVTRLDEPHKLITETHSDEEAGTCGTEGHSEQDTITDPLETLTSDIERVRRQSPNGAYIVELAIVNDNRQYVYHGRNLDRTVRDALDIVNAADAIYRPLNIRLIVAHVITWTSGDRIAVVSNPGDLLERIRAYKSSVSQTHDSLMLLTGQDLDGSTVGIAYLNTMCGSAAVGVTQGGGRATSSTASTFAHEVGHEFSLQHDQSGCSCSDPLGRCVMAAISIFPGPEQWSSCSVSAVNSALTRSSNNLGRCLTNEPTNIVGEPSCGNGLREGDEVCDCGTAAECDDPCCDPATCRMRAGAQCTRGECCTSTCQFRSYGTTCRGSSGQCDIAEYCSGESSECPTDVYVQDGNSCNNNQAYCFSGECQTYNDQCQYHFGTNMGVRECYTAYNPQGSVFGNCGYTSTNYIPCSQSDALCGQLFCESGDYQGRVSGIRVTIVTVGVFVNSQSRQCRGFTPAPGTDILSPGLVRDGTKCSEGRMCFNQRCQAVSDVPGVGTCPQANGLECSGRGQCNSRGQCSCNVGFVGAACETVFGGIMVDECTTGQHNCDQECVDTEESFFCTCRSGFTLASDGRTCNIDCGGRLTTATGTFTSPGYPNSYPANGVVCEWIIEIPNNGGTIEFTIDESRFGINGRPTCTDDHIEFFDGTANSASSLEKICGLPHFYTNGLPTITTTSSTARVVFTGSDRSRPASRIGVSVSYRTVVLINECQVSNGGCDHICTDTDDSFQCSCRTGHTLGSDQRSCIDVNECSSNNGDCQQICENTDGSFRCACNSGYSLNSDSETCSDINECSQGTDNCAQECTNTDGSYICSCRSGFRLNSNGASCNDINECSSGSHNCDQGCSNTAGSFTCSCNSGFTLGSDGRTCTSNGPALVNECLENNGGCSQICTDTTNSLECSCNPGYTLGQDGTSCIDVNECNSNNGGCQQNCYNYVGSFICWCNRGFTQASDRSSCTDTDECAIGTHNCQQTCTNTAGSFTCSCNTGYTLANDGRSCTDIDECAAGTDDCDHSCSNTAGSFTCSCNSGFTLASDGRTCTSDTQTLVNECLENNGGCSQTCTDTTGSFECSCNNGFILGVDGLSCIDNDECASNNGDCQQNCFNYAGSFVCWCNSGYRLANDGRSCNDVDECSEGTDNCEQTCTNTQGSFTCSCREGFVLDSNSRTCSEDTSSGICGGSLTEESDSFQSPGWPAAYPQDNFQCEWIITLPDGGAKIEFTTDNSAFGINGRSPCTNDYIEFFDGVESTSISLHKACFYDVPPVITTTSSRARVIFRGTINPSRPRGRVGVRVSYRTVQPSTVAPPPTTEAVTTAPPPEPTGTGCGSFLTVESDSFQTPGWPAAYPQDNILCEWIISLPDGGATIEFTTDETAFGINGRSPCTNDYIEFFDGVESTSTSLHKACFYDVPPVITTTSSRARVIFRGSINPSRPSGRVGVRVSYRTVQPEPEVTVPVPIAPNNPSDASCGSTLTAPSGSFQSEGWPNKYDNENFQCEWRVQLPDNNRRIQFTIDEPFGINGRSPCTTDHIEFFDGTNSNAVSLAKICGLASFYGGSVPTITTSSSSARIVFTGSTRYRSSSRIGVRVLYTTVQ